MHADQLLAGGRRGSPHYYLAVSGATVDETEAATVIPFP